MLSLVLIDEDSEENSFRKSCPVTYKKMYYFHEKLHTKMSKQCDFSSNLHKAARLKN